ncbi:RB1-inducible coiled-coil protein 1-like isoform X2 [Dreissena polymorpha]|uniref:RB1-inducible coiled-coil protein 1-like isoform X2 n=1 Tax=Dreissena polymorpha TaxID=45954 RepID=UPI00226554B7|nr:RB1-inducible coiled-coil protein 1-like isoform X2 [Dreissena polymorpha]
MLYVFHVDTGTMMTFDMNLAMESVSVLQSVIARGYRIPEEKQVLLISGGESLDPTAMVGKYHAGTDTNPIFLFSKSTIESSVPPSPSVNYGSDVDLEGQVEGSLIMPPAYETVVSRAQLALQFQEVDTEELRACERLIHDQHLQQQGWAAVVANLEDITGELKQRTETFHESFKQYLECRNAYRELITSVNHSLDLLSRIPVLPSLVTATDNMAAEHNPDEVSQLMLFDWISSQDSNHTLQDMVEQCDKATEQLDSRVEECLHEDVAMLMREVANDSMKEVKGLEDRLYGLDQLIYSGRKLVQEQADLAKGFVQNQNRLSNVRDRSILPDLCSSHRNQLVEMLKNHTRIREIKKKCCLAKEELSVNLHTRLRWVMYIEKKLCDVDGKLSIYLGNLRRLRKRLDILQQVQDAPNVYAKLVLEVVRRKQFSSRFHSWACNLADESCRLHTEEVKRREIFLRIIGHHFLQSMFPGLEDFPPSFATQAPEVFDLSLPEITIEDVNGLKHSVPELLDILSEPVEGDWLLFTHMKDSSETWLEESTGHSLHNLHVKPTNTRQSQRSDTNVTFEPYSVDNGSISLGDQFTECEQDEDITQKPEFFSLSPPDKDFMLAKSLSEELTKEMKETSSHLKQKLKASASAEVPFVKCLITEDAHMPALKRRKPSVGKSVCETSPDMDTSQEFQTLDCYIDESMPSSIDSPPKPISERKASLEESFSDMKKNNLKLLQQLNLCNKQISDGEQKIKLLQEIVCDNLPVLRALVDDLKNTQQSCVQNILSDFDHIKNKLPEVIKAYATYAEANNLSVIDHLKAIHADSLKTLNELINIEKKHVIELEEKVEEKEQEKKQIEKDLKTKLDFIKKENEDLGESLAREVQNLTLNHELELEVELDKVKAEYVAIIGGLEQDIESKNSVICDKERVIQNILTEKDTLEVILNNKYLKERERIEAELKHFKEKASQMNELESELNNFKKVAFEKENELHVVNMKLKVIVDKKIKTVDVQTDNSVCITKVVETQTDQIDLDGLRGELEREREEVEQLKTSLTTLTSYHQVDLEGLRGELEREREEVERIKTSLTTLTSEHQVELERLRGELKREREEVEPLKTNLTTLISEHQVELNGLREELKREREEVERLKTNLTTLINKHQEELDGLRGELKREREEIEPLKTNLTTLISEHQVELDGLREELKRERDEVERLKTRHTALTGNHQTELDGLSEELDRKKEEVERLKTSLTTLTSEHNVELEGLSGDLEREREEVERLKTSLTSLTGEKQTKFNEALSRVCREKDKVIEEMRLNEHNLVEKINQTKEDMQTLLEEKCKAEDVKERALSLLKEKEREFGSRQWQLENQLHLCQQELHSFKEQVFSMAGHSDNTLSSPSVVNISDPELPNLQQRIQDLEQDVKYKEEEISKMQQKVMELSMSVSTRSLVQEKVSITSCQVGDLVLLCLDERLNQYVVFTVGSTLHFLHTECLTHLGLKPEPGQPKKQWLIAEVMEKEYCQAKKATNRFNVPVGTKFYRVKARQWSRESSQSASYKKSESATQ